MKKILMRTFENGNGKNRKNVRIRMKIIRIISLARKERNKKKIKKIRKGERNEFNKKMCPFYK